MNDTPGWASPGSAPSDPQEPAAPDLPGPARHPTAQAPQDQAPHGAQSSRTSRGRTGSKRAVLDGAAAARSGARHRQTRPDPAPNAPQPGPGWEAGPRPALPPHPAVEPRGYGDPAGPGGPAPGAPAGAAPRPRPNPE